MRHFVELQGILSNFQGIGDSSIQKALLIHGLIYKICSIMQTWSWIQTLVKEFQKQINKSVLWLTCNLKTGVL